MRTPGIARLIDRRSYRSVDREAVDLFVAQPQGSMATWEGDKFQEDEDTDGIGDSLDRILGAHDLQDCLDHTLDLTNFEVYEQGAVFDEGYSDDDAAINGRPIPADDNTTG